jgi:hypothetical protein
VATEEGGTEVTSEEGLLVVWRWLGLCGTTARRRQRGSRHTIDWGRRVVVVVRARSARGGGLPWGRWWADRDVPRD